MTLNKVLESLEQLKTRLVSQLKLIYLKLEIGPPATSDRVETLEAALPFALDPELKSMWSVAESVHFEWFIKSEGIRMAGLDTWLAPNGQFSMLTPEEAAQEYAFLSDLSDDSGQAMPFVPLARMHPNGELVAVDHSDNGAVVLVVLDLALTVYPLAPNLQDWLQQRIATYFCDSTLDPSVTPSPQLSSILEALNQSEVVWPPKKIGW